MGQSLVVTYCVQDVCFLLLCEFGNSNIAFTTRDNAATCPPPPKILGDGFFEGQRRLRKSLKGLQETPHNSQPAVSTAFPVTLFSVVMKATAYDKEHEHQAIFGLVILLVSALAAALVLWAKLYYMM